MQFRDRGKHRLAPLTPDGSVHREGLRVGTSQDQDVRILSARRSDGENLHEGIV